MAFDKFKSYKATPNEPYVSKNPYVQRAAQAKKQPDTTNPPTVDDELKKNNTVIAKLAEITREMKDLRLDIASLLLFIQGDMDTQFTAADARKIYFDFKASKGHLLSRIEDKIDPKTGQSNL